MLRIAGGEIDVSIAGDTGVPRAAVVAWVETAARAISGYFGRFPVAQVFVEVHGGGAQAGAHGQTFGGERIRVSVGRDTRAEDLADDWVLTHEMFHLAFPSVDARYHWMEEGLSTYLEPIARARLGTLPPEKVWADMVEGLPNGLPRAGDRGLDRTPTWGRTYWGGCLFWFLADVRIREATHNRKSLDDAIRAILNAGGDGSAHWSLGRVLDVGDGATGTTVLHDLHEQMGRRPDAPDLDALWARLGVVYRQGQVTFDDRARLADLRASITARTAATTRPDQE